MNIMIVRSIGDRCWCCLVVGGDEKKIEKMLMAGNWREGLHVRIVVVGVVAPALTTTTPSDLAMDSSYYWID